MTLKYYELHNMRSMCQKHDRKIPISLLDTTLKKTKRDIYPENEITLHAICSARHLIQNPVIQVAKE